MGGVVPLILQVTGRTIHERQLSLILWSLVWLAITGHGVPSGNDAGSPCFLGR